MRTAVFAGSFRPFTIGHMDILRRGLQLFDRVIVVRGINRDKADLTNNFGQNLTGLISSIKGAELIEHDGLTAELAQRVGASALLRGVRSTADFEYERNLADANKARFGVETVLLTARPDLAWISSSTVRELASFGQDISDLLP